MEIRRGSPVPEWRFDMSKIICDVCGTDYPETAEQCPICGCARTDGGQTSLADTVPGEEETVAYNYVKGGRFSKANVRKRLRANQQYTQEQEPVADEEPGNDEEDEEYDDQEGGSNRALIVVVILLLLAIIAVSSYIAVNYLGLGKDDSKTTNGSTQSQSSTTAPNTSSDTTGQSGSENPCTGLTTTDRSIELKTKGSAWLLNVAAEPADTTDSIVYTSSDPNVATVDSDGLVTAVGSGEATITITCGEFTAECSVLCSFEADPTDPGSDPTDTTAPTADPDEIYTVKFNGQTSRWGNDTTINAGSFFNLTLEDSQGKAMDVVWTVDDETVCSVNGKVVTGLNNGKATLKTTFGGIEYTCIVRVKGGTTATEPPATDESGAQTPTEAPAEVPVETYTIMINGLVPYYGNGSNLADTSELVGSTFTLTVENEMGARMPMDWTVNNPVVCTMDGNKVTCVGAGKAEITAVYEGVTYKVIVRVSEPTPAETE